MAPPPRADRSAGGRFAAGGAPFSAARANRVVRALIDRSPPATMRGWLAAVARRVTTARPDLAGALTAVLRAEPAGEDVLDGLSIGEIGVCYEALLAQVDGGDRRRSGQFFTPDDAAAFMAGRSIGFPPGVWLDPCCGVGNLSWHLAGIQDDPGEFVRERLVLIDRDAIALHSAVALIAADHAAPGDIEAVRRLSERARRRDSLDLAPLPEHDFAILNPPYARAPERPGYATSRCRDHFAHFLERIARRSRGFIAVSPASYLSAPKFAPLRAVLAEHRAGGDVYVFDNVPDTLFRGYKFGSNNTSKTNFVRAAITVCPPDAIEWRLTPIIRWQAATREQMWEQCPRLLSPRRIGPHGEWAKLAPGMERTWDALGEAPDRLADLVVEGPTPHRLEVALTPRYFISAAFGHLDRSSKAVLHFASAAQRDRAAVVLNSSLPYLWWRALDGGVTLPRRVLMSVPVPRLAEPDPALIARLRESERRHRVVKLNAGRQSENIKHPPELVRALDEMVLPGVGWDAELLYASSMFPLARTGAPGGDDDHA